MLKKGELSFNLPQIVQSYRILLFKHPFLKASFCSNPPINCPICSEFAPSNSNRVICSANRTGFFENRWGGGFAPSPNPTPFSLNVPGTLFLFVHGSSARKIASYLGYLTRSRPYVSSYCELLARRALIIPSGSDRASPCP